MKNIIITGGELRNKGAQAMTFVAVDELKKRYPDHEVFLLSPMDFERPEEERSQYAFRFLPWEPIKFARAQKNPLLRAACLARNGKEYRATEEVYRNCDLMIDVSGYALGSVWSDVYCNTYLDHLEYAEAFRIPVYLMPQSFGPFDFRGDGAEKLHARIQRLLPGVKVICAREQEGFDALTKRYGLTNVQRKPDLVLNNRGVDRRNLFRDEPGLHIPEIRPGSVGIIPNGRIVDAIGEEAVLELYRSILSELAESGTTAYILSHATPDLALCRRIKEQMPGEDRVVHLEDDFSCLEFNEIVRHFRYVIASRFHSIVHAYKNDVPCISLGWAIKYRDLMAEFGQEEYALDVRDGIDASRASECIRRMEGRLEEEKKAIRNGLAEHQKENVFDILPEKL